MVTLDLNNATSKQNSALGNTWYLYQVTKENSSLCISSSENFLTDGKGHFIPDKLYNEGKPCARGWAVEATYCESIGEAIDLFEKQVLKLKKINTAVIVTTCTSCVECPYHIIHRDPDPFDSWGGHEEALLCQRVPKVWSEEDIGPSYWRKDWKFRAVKTSIGTYTRPILIPDWCPYIKN